LNFTVHRKEEEKKPNWMTRNDEKWSFVDIIERKSAERNGYSWMTTICGIVTAHTCTQNCQKNQIRLRYAFRFTHLNAFIYNIRDVYYRNCKWRPSISIYSVQRTPSQWCLQIRTISFCGVRSTFLAVHHPQTFSMHSRLKQLSMKRLVDYSCSR